MLLSTWRVEITDSLLHTNTCSYCNSCTKTKRGHNKRPDHHEIIVSPDHPNIYLYKAKVNDEWNHLRKCDRTIKQYANGKDIKCLWTSILAEFGETESNAVGHDCCLLCVTVMEATDVANKFHMIFIRISHNEIRKLCWKKEK